jgi:hypothetical protein
LNAEIESLVRSYARLSRDVGGRINFACDLDDEKALDAAEREKAHLDQAFFVLSFATLELHITRLASARLRDEERRTAMRGDKFEKRWEAAVKVAKEVLRQSPPWERERSVVFSWYTIRSDIAHGRSPSNLADVSSVLLRADEVAATLDAVAPHAAR